MDMQLFTPNVWDVFKPEPEPTPAPPTASELTEAYQEQAKRLRAEITQRMRKKRRAKGACSRCGKADCVNSRCYRGKAKAKPEGKAKTGRPRNDNEERPNITQLSKATGIGYGTLLTRWNAGKRGDDLTRPVNPSKIPTCKHLDRSTIKSRWDRGDRGERLFRPKREDRLIRGKTMRQWAEFVEEKFNVPCSADQLRGVFQYRRQQDGVDDEAALEHAIKVRSSYAEQA